MTYLDIVAFVVVAALSEQSMSDNSTSVEHIKYGIGVLVVSKIRQSTVQDIPWRGMQ
jgi:hypothetical protein